MAREDQVEKMLDELEREFVKANMPINDKLTLFARVSNVIYKYTKHEPCDDVISRQAVLNLPRRALKNYFGEITAEMIYVKDVEKLPSVAATGKAGHWIFVHPLQENDGGSYMCSICNVGDWNLNGKENYCPNCGAKMQEVEE